MNLLNDEINFYFLELRKKLQNETPIHSLALAIPYIYVARAAIELGNEVQILSQDVHHIEKGAFTSCISATQLGSINVHSSLIGHSECRMNGQDEKIISKKVRTALINGFSIIYCCGKDPIKEIKNELFFIQSSDLERVMIAYEPIGSIGSGAPTPSQVVVKKLQEIRELVIDMWGEDYGKKVKLLYGGSVNEKNYQNYLQEDVVDGVLVGSASLNVQSVWEMVMNR